MDNMRDVDSLHVETLVPEINLIKWPPEKMALHMLDKNKKYLPEKDKYEKYEPAQKKQKQNDQNDKTVLGSVHSRDGESNTLISQFKTTTTNCKENSKTNLKKSDTEEYYNNNAGKNDENNYIHDTMDYTSTIIESTDGQMDFSNEPVNVFTADSSKFGKVTVRDMRTLFKPHEFKNFCVLFLPETTEKDEIESTSECKNSDLINSTKKLSLSEVESLYQKYFSTSVQDTIVIIANILNITRIFNIYFTKIMYELFKAEKLNERSDVYKMFLGLKKILESKLKKYLLEVITRFTTPEFEHAFQILFLGIFSILKVFPKFKKIHTDLLNVDLLLWDCLKDSEIEPVEFYSTLLSKNFRHDCIDLMCLIEDSQKSDPGISNRMPIFFVSSVNSQQYFQAVINAVTSNSSDDLELLIDNALVQCNNSIFKSVTDTPSTVNKVINSNTPASATQSRPLKSNDSIQQRVPVKTPNGPFQNISVTVPKFKTNSPTILENGKASQQLNFSKCIAKFPSTVSKLGVPTRIDTSSPNVPNGTLQTKPTYLIIVRTLQSFSRSTSTRPTNTIYVGNKQYTGIPLKGNQSQAVNTIQNNVVTTPYLKCFANICQNQATIMCGHCSSVIYCSRNCQESDWYEVHVYNCESLNNHRMSSQTDATNVSDK